MKAILACLSMLISGLAAADAVSDGCLACHRGALALEGKETAQVEARLRDIRDGRLPHPAPLPTLDDSQLEALARALTANGD